MTIDRAPHIAASPPIDASRNRQSRLASDARRDGIVGGSTTAEPDDGHNGRNDCHPIDHARWVDCRCDNVSATWTARISAQTDTAISAR